MKRPMPEVSMVTIMDSTNPGWEARWPHGWYARLRIERSGFEPWPGTLCCVLGQDT